jgi:hypothetical protein
MQFWDKEHVIARQLDQQLAGIQPKCCRHSGTLWDVVALFAKGSHWGDIQPLFVDGPVLKVESELAKQTTAAVQ